MNVSRDEEQDKRRMDMGFYNKRYRTDPLVLGYDIYKISSKVEHTQYLTIGGGVGGGG